MTKFSQIIHILSCYSKKPKYNPWFSAYSLVTDCAVKSNGFEKIELWSEGMQYGRNKILNAFKCVKGITVNPFLAENDCGRDICRKKSLLLR